ncbi:hypothetical protein DSO57_1024111 [Entomophthora muscae]|uniref:Uncharacterized protein n=1 Tax=Entomophthora muscae TaxID=34485 RepID=A0ACC2T2Y8_9FUNG|nr:hypothetical protein DSO57_1024111 [Entomophthora muscae]
MSMSTLTRQRSAMNCWLANLLSYLVPLLSHYRLSGTRLSHQVAAQFDPPEGQNTQNYCNSPAGNCGKVECMNVLCNWVF